MVLENHMHRTITAISIIAGCACAHAQPTSFQPDLLAATLLNGSVFEDVEAPYPLLTLQPGGELLLEPFNDAFASPMRVTYGVETVGNTRTVSLLYETFDGSPFVSQALVDTLDRSPQADYALFFAVGFDDPEWTGAPVTRFRALRGDGVDLFTASPVVLSPTTLSPPLIGLVDENSPAGPGFGRPTSFTGGAIADTFVYELTYEVIPAPATVIALLAPLAVCTRRRR